MKENQLFLMKRVEALTQELAHVMRILDLISQLVEQDEEKEQFHLDSDSSDEDSIGTIGSKDIQLIDDDSDDEE